MSSFPTCQDCHQKFSPKGPAPFLLPCLHSLCETCVTSADGGVISCSTCQRDINLTETRLQKDVITEKEILHLTVQHNPELVLCTHEDDGNQAVCWCKECEDFLCEHCQNVHGSFKGTRQHIVYDVGELELGNLNEGRYCRVHPKFIADTWDTDCCILTCRKCRHGEHSGHKTVDVEEAAQTSRKAVSTLQEEVQYLVDIHETHSEGVTKDLQTSAKGNSIIPENISHTFHSLKTLVDQREVEIRIAHQQLQDAVTRQLQDKKNSSNICHQRCQTTSDYIIKALKYSSMHDIVELTSLLEEKYKDCRSSAPPEDYRPLPLPIFNTNGLALIKSSLCKFGVITTDDVFENRTEDCETEIEDDLEEEVEEEKEKYEKAKGFENDIDTHGTWPLTGFLTVIVLALICIAFYQKDSDCDTQTDILIKKIRQLEASEETLIRERKEKGREYDTQTEFFRQKIEQLEESEEYLIQERKENEIEYDAQTEMLSQKIRQLEAAEENLKRMRNEREKEYRTQTESLRQKIRQLEESKENLIRKREEEERECSTQTDILTQKIRQLEKYEGQLIRKTEENRRELETQTDMLTKAYKQIEGFEEKRKKSEEKQTCWRRMGHIVDIPILGGILPFWSGMATTYIDPPKPYGPPFADIYCGVYVNADGSDRGKGT